MRQILTKYGEIEALSRLFKVSRVTVRTALGFRSNSEMSKRIRTAALERGGKETTHVEKHIKRYGHEKDS